METIRREIEKKDPTIVEFLMPDCVYRGGCHEFQSCGYYENRGKNERRL